MSQGLSWAASRRDVSAPAVSLMTDIDAGEAHSEVLQAPNDHEFGIEGTEDQRRRSSAYSVGIRTETISVPTDWCGTGL